MQSNVIGMNNIAFGYSALKNANYTLGELISGGYRAKDLLGVYTTNELLAYGFTTIDLLVAGYTI